MVARITINILRTAALLALILGVLDWVGHPIVPIGIHMLLGIIVVLSLWVLGGVMLRVSGGMGLAIGAFVLGLIVLAIGLTQKQILPEDTSSLHWIVQVIHLLIGLSAIGMGEAINGRYRRQSQVAKMQAR